jgi:hypothetical protein
MKATASGFALMGAGYLLGTRKLFPLCCFVGGGLFGAMAQSGGNRMFVLLLFILGLLVMLFALTVFLLAVLLDVLGEAGLLQYRVAATWG